MTEPRLDTILLDRGLEGLSFGASDADVRESLGTDCRQIPMEDDDDYVLAFESLGLECTFWADFDFRLGYVSTERSGAALLGEELIGKSLAEVRTFIDEKLGSTELDEDGCVHENGSVQSWIEVEDRNVTFWFADEVLYSIGWTVPWEGEEPSWPA